MLKLLMGLSFLISGPSYSDEIRDLITRTANLPQPEIQAGFAEQKDLNHFARRFRSHETSAKRLIDLANFRHADLDLDKCLTTKEYKLFLAAQELWLDADYEVKRSQVLAYFSPWYWSLAGFNAGSKGYKTMAQIAKSETSIDWLVLFYNSNRSRWDKDEEFEVANREWEAFKALKSRELDKFSIEKLAEIKTCTPGLPPEKSKKQTDYLQAAKEIYNVILPRLDEIKKPGQWSGKAGAAAFIGVLSAKSENLEMREQALKLLEEARALCLKNNDSTFLEGSPGIAMAALAVYKVTRDQRFLKIAVQMGAASSINEFNEQAYGSAGIGLMLIAMHRETKDAKWLNRAKEVARDLEKKAVNRGNLSWWPMGSVFPSVFAGFGHGSAGIGYFFAKLYEDTGSKEYLAWAVRAARHVLDTAHENSLGFHWTWYQPPIGYGSIWKYQWSHGNFGIAYLFEVLSRITSDREWKVALEKTLRPAVQEGVTFGYDDGGQCCGKSGQGDLWIELYRKTKQEKYLSRAKELVPYLMDHEGKVRLKYGRTPKDYPLGYNGLSGIGLFLLQVNSPDELFLPFQ